MNEDFTDELLSSLYANLDENKGYLNGIRKQVLESEVSNYPIIIASRAPISIGSALTLKYSTADNWNYAASHLEEFFIKKIINQENIDNFRRLYKRHLNELCVFIAEEGAYNFVFVPV